MTRVIELARTKLVTADIETPINVLAKMMWDNNIGSILLTENDKIVGFIDDRSLFQLVSNNINPLEKKPREILKSLETIKADWDIEEAWDFMKTTIGKRFGVVDDNGKVLGILNKKTLGKIRLRLLKEELGIED
ncbi:MAG: CBS domain-containing protein [Promethearchaeota archaeon]